MKSKRSHVGGFSAIGVTAALSVLILIGAIGWQTYQRFAPPKAPEIAQAATSTPGSVDAHISDSGSVGSTAIGAAVLDELVARYTALQQKGIYTPEAGQKAAEEMASTISPDVPYTHHVASDITTDPDTSVDRVLAYRHDLQISLAPLLKNTQAEFEIFAYYTDTKDPKYLMQLREVANNYRAAAQATAHVIVPKNAVDTHVAILNALDHFAAILDAQVTNANDPLASLVLLKAYNEGEAEVFASFNSLATYFKKKTA